MTPAELRAIIEGLGMTQTRAAQCLGVERRTLTMWLAGDRAIPELAARVTRLAEDGKLDLADLVARRTQPS